MTTPGQIIFIHGASSAGKSTLAKALQDSLDVPFWHISIDHLRDSGVLPMARIKAGAFDWKAMRGAFFDGFHRSLAAYAGAGNNLILEHILDTPALRQDLGTVLAPFDVFTVALHCPVEELNAREQARGDRPIGSAEADFHRIHQGMTYDLELASGEGVAANVARLIAAWEARAPGPETGPLWAR